MSPPSTVQGDPGKELRREELPDSPGLIPKHLARGETEEGGRSRSVVVVGENEIVTGIDFGNRLIDEIAPVVTLTAPSLATVSSPFVTVTATDNMPLPDGIPVLLDVDLNNDKTPDVAAVQRDTTSY